MLRRHENKGFEEYATNLIENLCLNERTQRVVLDGIELDGINLKKMSSTRSYFRTFII